MGGAPVFLIRRAFGPECVRQPTSQPIDPHTHTHTRARMHTHTHTHFLFLFACDDTRSIICRCVAYRGHSNNARPSTRTRLIYNDDCHLRRRLLLLPPHPPSFSVSSSLLPLLLPLPPPPPGSSASSILLHPSPSPPPCPPSSSSPLHTHICTQHAHSTSLSMDVFLLFNQAHTIRDIFLNSCLARQAWKPRYPSLKIC